MSTTAGTLQVLNVGLGDLKVSFDPSDPEEEARAKKMVEDLLKAGYALVVEDEDGEHHVVQSFDPEQNEYLVRDMDFRKAKGEARERRRPAPTKRVPARRSRARAVAPTAGG